MQRLGELPLPSMPLGRTSPTTPLEGRPFNPSRYPGHLKQSWPQHIIIIINNNNNIISVLYLQLGHLGPFAMLQLPDLNPALQRRLHSLRFRE